LGARGKEGTKKSQNRFTGCPRKGKRMVREKDESEAKKGPVTPWTVQAGGRTEKWEKGGRKRGPGPRNAPQRAMSQGQAELY